MATDRGKGSSKGSLRTRSQVAPDWTLQESLILVNEICAVERDCLHTLSSFQKWKIIVENCHALEVNRSLSQCRRQWDSLLADYNKIKLWDDPSRSNGGEESYWSLDRDDDRRKRLGLPESFSIELFKAIDDHVRELDDDGCDTEPETDPDAEPEAASDDDADADPLLSVIAQSGSLKQRHRVIPQKRCIEERVEPQRRIKSEQKIVQKISNGCSSEQMVESLANNFTEKLMHGESSQEERLQAMQAKLRETAEMINNIVKRRLTEADYKLTADLTSLEAIQTDFTRRQGDKLINCLGDLHDTIDQLCTLV